MARALGPVLPAAALAFLPLAVFSTFLVPIADTTGAGVAAVGSLRGLGGVAAALVGGALTPLLERVPRNRVTVAGLLLLAVASVSGAFGHFVSVVVFSALVGMAMAMLGPGLAAGAADRFDGDEVAAARAATLVAAAHPLMAMLGAPLVVLLSLPWGWQGSLVTIAALAVVLAVVFARRGPPARDRATARLGYLQTWRELRAVPGAAVVLVVTLLRLAAFMGYLAYMAAFYSERFGLSPAQFAWVWALSGTSFFVGNLVGRRTGGPGVEGIGPRRLLVWSSLLWLAALLGFYASPGLWWALAATVLLGASHAVTLVCLMTLLLQRSGRLRGPALGVSAAAVNLGQFVGAVVGGAGLAVAGWPGTAAVLVVVTVMALLLALRVRPVTQGSAAGP